MKQEKNKQHDYQTYEKGYQQLLYIVFTVCYLENRNNEYLNNFFEVEVKANIKIMKMILDIVTATLRRA